MTQFFANTAASRFAQAACAAFPCTENSMMIISPALFCWRPFLLFCLWQYW